jgi:hypothetical protein
MSDATLGIPPERRASESKAAPGRLDREQAHSQVSQRLEHALRRAGDGSHLLVLGSAIHALDYVASAHDDRNAPRTVDDLALRISEIADLTAESAALVVESARADHESVLPIGDDRFVALLPSSKELAARLTEVRANVERRFLEAFSGQVAFALVFIEVSAERIGEVETADRLEREFQRRRMLPFLDALTLENAFGPFPVSETMPAPPRPQGPSIGVVVRRSSSPPNAGRDLVTCLAQQVERASFARGDGEGCGFASADGELIAGDLESVLRAAFAQSVDELRDGCLVIEATRHGEVGFDGALTRAVAAGREAFRGVRLFGATVVASRVEEAFRLGVDLAPLAREHRSAFAGLLELAVSLDAGMDRAPLLLLSRWRAQAHALAARLGMGERAVRKPNEWDDAATRALRTLIGEFPKWFDSGAARAPLRLALALGSSQPEVSSA